MASAPRTAVALLGVLFVPAAQAGGWAQAGPQAIGAPWSYAGETGPERWGSLSPAFSVCAQGTRQSPVDIRPRDPREVQLVPYAPLVFQYRSQSLRTANDGRQVHILADRGSELRLAGERWALTGLHFHVPGEHRLQGRAADGEIHFVHENDAGRLAVVAVPLKAGRRVNSVLMRILDRLPQRPGKELRHERIGINPLFLLPSERDYFTYTGSLETPPCSEPVQWFVLVHPLELDAEQIRRLAAVTGPNARPVQPLNGRVVQGVLRTR